MRLARLITGTAIAATTLGTAAPAAQAAAPISINIHVAPQVDVGGKVGFTWAATHIPKGDKVVVQRSIGTANAWKTVAPIRAAHGAGKFSAPPTMGKYWVRILVVNKNGRGVRSVKRAFEVFGKVTLAQLIPDTASGTATLGTTIFNYIGYSYNPWLISNTRCNFVHLDWAEWNGNDNSSTPPATVTLTLIQETLDPVVATGPWGAVNSLDASLVPGKQWGWQWADHHAWSSALNGWAMCSAAGTGSVQVQN